MIVLVGYKKCGTCRKAMKWLEEQGIPYEFRDIVSEKPSEKELREWIAQSGLTPARFFNTSGGAYRELNVKERLGSMSGDETVELLASDGMLVKRPVLVSGEKVLVGFRQEQWEEALL